MPILKKFPWNFPVMSRSRADRRAYEWTDKVFGLSLPLSIRPELVCTLVFTWWCVGIHGGLDHQGPPLRRHGDSHLPLFVLGQGRLHRLCVHIWRQTDSRFKKFLVKFMFQSLWIHTGTKNDQTTKTLFARGWKLKYHSSYVVLDFYEYFYVVVLLPK